MKYSPQFIDRITEEDEIVCSNKKDIRLCYRALAELKKSKEEGIFLDGVKDYQNIWVTYSEIEAILKLRKKQLEKRRSDLKEELMNS